MFIRKISVFFTCFLLASCHETSKPALATNADSLSYYLGIYTGLTLKEARYNQFNKAAFTEAVAETFGDSHAIHDNDFKSADSIVQFYITKGRNLNTLIEATAFLEENKKQEGITTTASGLQYRVFKEGKGRRPLVGDTITILFRGTRLDGVEYMNLKQPTTMVLREGTKGAIEGIQLMREGAKYRFFVPTALAFGLNPPASGIVKPNMALIYDVELVKVLPRSTGIANSSKTDP